MYSLIVENKYGERMELTGNSAYVITDVDGLYPPEAVINTTRTAGMDGSVFNSSYVGDRQITITLAINGPAEENRLNLYRYFKAKYPVRIYYKNGARDVFIDGYVQKITAEYFAQKQTAQIVIDCPKCLFSAAEETVIQLSGVEEKFYFPFSTPSPGIPMSVIRPKVQKNITNGGDVETGVVITLNALGNVKNPKIYNVDTKDAMILNVDLLAGDEVTINTRMKEKSVRLLREGAETNLIGKLQPGSVWFQLAPGDNIFTYDADESPEKLQCFFLIRNQFEGV